MLEKINKLLRLCRKHLKIYTSRRAIRQTKKNHPEFFKPIDRTIESRHKEIWSVLYPRIDLSYLRYYSNFSGNHDPRFVPQDLHFAIIERVMNDMNKSGFISHKSMLDKVFGKENVPVSLIRRISSTFLDIDFNIITEKQARDLFHSIHQDVLVKPAKGSGGGKNIRMLRFGDGGFYIEPAKPVNFDWLLEKYGDDFVIQEVIQQHEELARLNPSSVNSVRINTYRSVRDETVHILARRILLGGPGGVVSNVKSGGYMISVDQSGKLHEYAANNQLEKYHIHPFNGIVFKDYSIPHFDKIRELVINTASRIPSARMIGFDTTVTNEGKPLLIEMNTKNVGINQSIGYPLYGDLTFEIIEDILSRLDMDDYKMLRTK